LSKSFLPFLIYLSSIFILIFLTKITNNKFFLYISYLSLFPLFIYYVLLYFNNTKSISKNMFFIFALLVIFWISSCIGLININTAYSLQIFFAKYFTITLTFIVFIAIEKKEHITHIIYIFFIFIVLSSIYSIFQYQFGYLDFETVWATNMGKVHGLDVWTHEQRRPFGIFLYSSENALIMGLTLILTLVLNMKLFYKIIMILIFKEWIR